jgi:hypothetical protein
MTICFAADHQERVQDRVRQLGDRMRLFLIVAAGAAICLHPRAEAQGFDCPAPMKQVASNVKGDIDAQAQGLLKVAGAGLKGAVETSVVNLFEKYPNADKIAMVQNYQSLACNMIKSSTLPDERKFMMILELGGALEKFIR